MGDKRVEEEMEIRKKKNTEKLEKRKNNIGKKLS